MADLVNIADAVAWGSIDDSDRRERSAKPITAAPAPNAGPSVLGDAFQLLENIANAMGTSCKTPSEACNYISNSIRQSASLFAEKPTQVEVKSPKLPAYKSLPGGHNRE